MGHNRFILSGMKTLKTPPKNAQAASQPSMTAVRVWENVNHTNMCREYTAVKINACTTRRRPVRRRTACPSGRSRSALHPGSPSTTGTVPPGGPDTRCAPAITVQRALRHHHPWRASRSPILTTVKPFFDPLVDPIVVGAQHFPRRSVPLGAVRAHRGHHRADQLIMS